MINTSERCEHVNDERLISFSTAALFKREAKNHKRMVCNCQNNSNQTAKWFNKI
jgi:hypothetical protein